MRIPRVGGKWGVNICLFQTSRDWYWEGGLYISLGCFISFGHFKFNHCDPGCSERKNEKSHLTGSQPSDVYFEAF